MPRTNAFFVYFCLTSSVKQRHEMNNIFEVLRRETAINGYFCLQYFLSVYPSLLLRQLVLILYSYRPETIIYDYIMSENTNLYFGVQSWFP